MASLVKNGSTYGLIWTDSSRDPRQTRESLKTGNHTEAKRLKARLEHDYWHGDHDPWERKWYQRETKAAGATLRRAVERFIAYKSGLRGRGSWSDATERREASVLRKFVRIVGDKALSRLTPKDLEEFYYRDSVSSDHTRDSDYISINAFLNWALREGIIEDKPEFRPPKPQAKTPKFIHPRELARLIGWKLGRLADWRKNPNFQASHNKGSYIPLAWMLLVGTGMRPKELAHLKVSHMKGQYAIVGEGFTTKTRAERTVPLLFEAPAAARILTDPRLRAMDPATASSDYLLGRTPSYVKNKISREFTAAWKDVFPDQPKRTLYNLKDTFAVRFLYGQKGNMNDLANILGHASLNTTRRYLKAVPYGTSIEGTIWDYPPPVSKM